MAVGGRDELETPINLRGQGFGGVHLAGHGHGSGGGRQLDVQRLCQMRRLPGGRRRRWRWWGVIHGHDLPQASREVAEQAGTDVGVDPLAGGEEPGHLVHALVETSPVFAQHRGVGAEGGCKAKKKKMGAAG